MTKRILGLLLCAIGSAVYAQDFQLNKSGYFRSGGVDVMAFDDIYPEGHQGGVSILMYGNRVATNGDIRLEATPGQWQPVPKQRNRVLDADNGAIVTTLSYPDSSRHMTGFNPMVYPDLQFNYTVTTRAVGRTIEVTVDLDRPIPQEFVGKVGFNMELFPGALFGKPWIMDGATGIFPQQPNGPTMEVASSRNSFGDYAPELSGSRLADTARLKGTPVYNPMVADNLIAEPYAVGRKFTVRPDDPMNRYSIESQNGDLQLFDGRMNHNNGWFVLRTEIPAGVTRNAVKWVIAPNLLESWTYAPVVQTSQVGYHPNQTKKAVIETDASAKSLSEAKLYRITPDGEVLVLSEQPKEWGNFLRYKYLTFDFSAVKDEGLYKISYGESESSVFRVAHDVYARGVWQPVLDYFLPVQMCHVRVNEKYRVWHDACHLDDARMAPMVNHFDGYAQDETLTRFKPGDVVPGLNVGGWHDAGDFDLRVESQVGESYILALAYEMFHESYDVTDIDHAARRVEIHQPDGKPDMLQQVENGALSVVNGYRALGRLYRGIICNDLRQYVMLGDASAMTDNVIGNTDDRWVFTEDNPRRELSAAAALAAISRVMKGFNDTLSIQALTAARELYDVTRDVQAQMEKVQAATELYLTTGEKKYASFLLSQQSYIVRNIDQAGWFIARAEQKMKNARFTKSIRMAMANMKKHQDQLSAETPYGIPYRPYIWGAGWGIQAFGCQQYFLVKAYPDIFNAEPLYDALNFVLGCHPGSNTVSFASGVGAKSATVAYGVNRADWSYIPGGVISGTALIRPDFPELLTFPYLWQQTEYVLGGGSSHYMFLVLAAEQLLNEK